MNRRKESIENSIFQGEISVIIDDGHDIELFVKLFYTVRILGNENITREREDRSRDESCNPKSNEIETLILAVPTSHNIPNNTGSRIEISLVRLFRFIESLFLFVSGFPCLLSGAHCCYHCADVVIGLVCVWCEREEEKKVSVETQISPWANTPHCPEI